MSEVRTSIAIAAPVQAVWDACMDPERLAEWVTIHRRLHEHTGGPLRAGYEMRQRLCLRGVPFDVQWKLVRCEPPHVAEWHGDGPARSQAETEYRLDDDGAGGTAFHYRNEFRPPMGPVGALASRALVGGVPEREAGSSLLRLKALVERG